MKKALLSIGLTYISLLLLSQDGPGGIGNSNGSNNHPKTALWLIADSISENTDNTDINTWTDFSGNNNHLTTSVNGNDPSVRTNFVNGHKAVQFEDANDERIIINPFNDLPTEEHSIFIVNQTSDNVASFLSYNATGGENELLLFENNTFNVYIDGTNSSSDDNLHAGAWQIINSQWENSTGSLEVLQNANLVHSDNIENGTYLINGGCLALGGEQDGIDIYGQSNQDITGEIAEVIIFDTYLSNAQRIIIENYLSVKYGITITSDVYTGNDATYTNEVSGIGRESDGTWSSGNSGGLIISDETGIDTDGEYILFGHNNTVNGVSTSDLPTGVEARWARDWYIEKTGTVDARISFDFSVALNSETYPQEVSNYTLLYRNTTTGDYTELAISATISGDNIYFDLLDAELTDGYYTLGTTNETDSPVEGGEGQIWYSLLSDADWSDWETWTLDPSGNLPNNQESSIPGPSDKVVILSGKTIIADLDNLNTAEITINGTLDLENTSGHNFNTIKGNGKIKLSSDNFPDGDASDFITQYLGEGTVEYYGNSYEISQNLEFYHLVINLAISTNTLTLIDDLQVNGDLTLKQGELQINNTNTTNLNIEVLQDVIVTNDGSISTGTGDARHQFDIYGNLGVNGPVAFTSSLANDYNTLDPAYGIVDVNFLNDIADQEIDINASASFYRIEIDKGIDKTYILSIHATDASYFNLYGYAHLKHPSTEQMADVANALGLIAGTVRIGNNISIPYLTNTGNYNINRDATLWVDGGYAAVSTGNAIVPYGELKVTAGTFEAPVISGITTRGNGLINISGGTINTNQIRTSVIGSTNIGGYNQSGGTTNLLGTSTNGDYYVFNLTYSGNAFSMSGGTLHIHEAHGRGGIFIACDETNVNVTGGMVICEIDDNNDFPITSTAPFYNVIIRNTSGGNGQHILTEGVDVGSTDEYLAAQPLVVLNDLTIEEDAFLDHDGNDVTIGRNFSVSASSQQVGTNNYGYRYFAGNYNTTTFNGDSDATIYIGHAASDGYELILGNVSVEKPVGTSITVTGDLEKTAQYLDDNSLNAYYARLIRIMGSLDMESGILDQGEHSLRLFGPINITGNAECGVYEHGVTHRDALIMFKDNNIEVNTEAGAVMGNVKMNPNPDTDIVTLSSDLYIKRIAYYHGRIDMGSHNLKVDYLHRNGTLNPYNLNHGSAATEMLFGGGYESDGGLSLYVPAGTTDGTAIGFPIGVTGKYTPAEITLYNVVDSGYITVTPVDKELLTTDLTGGDILSYYWNIDFEGFKDTPTVVLNFTYDESDLDGSLNEALFVPGYVEDGGTYQRVNENDVAKVDEANNTITFNGAGSGFTLVNANFTAGEPNRFVGAPEVFYSRLGNGSNWYNRYWQDGNNWSFVAHDGAVDNAARPAAGDYPQSGDIAIIGYGGYDASGTIKHSINIRDGRTVDVAEIQYNNPNNNSSRLVLRNNVTLSFGKIGGTGGTFMQRYNTTNTQTITGDFGDFYNNNNFTYNYFLDGNGTYNITPPTNTFPNLRIEGGNVNRIAIFLTDIQVNNNMTVDNNSTLRTNNGADGDITVLEQLRIGGYLGGNFIFNDGAERTVEVGTLWFRGTANNSNLTVDNSTANSLTHYLIVNEDILQDRPGDFDLFSGNNATDNNVILELSGEGIHAYTRTDGDVPDLYRVVMNKGASQDNTFTLNNSIVLNGPTLGVGVDKALEMQNGTLILDVNGQDIILTSGDDDFVIPSTAGLELLDGQFTANGNSGILLDGKINIVNGTFDMSGGDNYIEYSASGNAELEISGGTLTVGSQIRRGLTSTEGILSYTQTGGMVIIAENSAPEGNRGVFEILNEGSSFVHTGGELYLVNAQTSATTASLILDPEYTNIGSGTKIYLGHNNTPAGQDFGINASINLEGLHLFNGSGNDPQATIWTVPLTLDDTLQFDTETTFDANGLDLILNGDLINRGTFIHNYNTTYLSGSTLQDIIGSTAFFNLDKTESNTVRINDSTLVENDLNVEGIIEDNDNTIYLLGDITNNGNITHSGTGFGLELFGSSKQIISGNGKYGQLTINNISGAEVYNSDTLYIDNTLRLENGILDIDRYLLYIDIDAGIEEGNTFSETNMIQTNISFTDNGVIKVFPSGAQTFTYPIGSQGKYSPVEFDINSNTNDGGYIRLRAADEIHPTLKYHDDPETGCQFDDSLNVLEYHWILESEGISGFSADVDFHFAAEDIQINNTCGYDESDYIPAQLLMNNKAWQKYSSTLFNTTSNYMRFEFSENDDTQISADYTAGLEVASDISAIIDSVAEYQTITDGDWTTATIWDPVVNGGPRGAAVTINDSVFIDHNYISVYTTEIAASGFLNANTSYGHRLGVVSGQGTLSVESGNLPAGYYNEFFSSNGGTLEYGGSSSFGVLSGISILNNLTFSGTNTKTLPNHNITLYGDLFINGDNNSLVVDNNSNRKLTLQGDLTKTNGIFTAGTGTNAEIEFSGSITQTIQGDFTGSSELNILTIDNTDNVTISGSVSVNSLLNLDDGNIVTDASNTLSLTRNATISGGSSSSFVDGPLLKEIDDYSSFEFPIGDNGRLGTLELTETNTSVSEYWEAEYIFETPLDAGMDPFSMSTGLQTVSQTEYWQITAANNGDEAKVKLRWDSQSDLPGTSDLSDLRIVYWNTAQSRWEEISDVTITGNATSGTIEMNDYFTFDGNAQYFTIASYDVLTAYAQFLGSNEAACSGDSIDVRISLTGEPNWTLTYAVDGVAQPAVSGITNSPFVIEATASATYSLVSISDNNGIGTVNTSTITTTIYPAIYLNAGADFSLCENESDTLGGSPTATGGDSSFTYLWSPATDLNNISIANPVTNPSETITYFITVADGNDCSVDDSITVTVDTLPDAQLTVADDTLMFGCDIFQFNSAAGMSYYTWTPADSLSNATISNPTYTPTSNPEAVSYSFTVGVEVMDGNGCTDSESIGVTLWRRPQTGPVNHSPTNWGE